jgi:hypothetical protein
VFIEFPFVDDFDKFGFIELTLDWVVKVQVVD